MVRIVKALVVVVFTLGSAWWVYSACVNGCPNQSGVGATVTGNPPTTSNELIVSTGPNQAQWEPFTTFITSVPTPAPFPISNYTGQVGITTGTGYGNDYMNGVCHDGDCPVTAFGASGLGASTLTGSINSNSTALVLTTQYDGPNYGYVRILGAGANQNFSQPSAPDVEGGLEEVNQQTIPGSPYQITVSPVVTDDIGVYDQTNGWPYQPHCPNPAQYQYCLSSSTYTFAAADTGHTVIIKYEANAGQSSPSSHTYQLVAADDAGGYSQASNATTVSIGTQAPPDYDESNFPSNGVLATSNAVIVVLPTLPTGATQWLICKDGNIYGYSENVWLHASPATAPVLAPTFVDTGIAHTPNNDFPTACPSSASADHFIAQVISGAGTNAVTLGTSASSTVTSATVYYDDTAAFQAACNAAIPSGGGNVLGKITVPDGTYNLTSTVTCGASGGLRTYGFTLEGSGLFSATLQWEGPKDGDPIKIVSPYGSLLSKLRMGGAPAASGFRFSTNNGAGTATNITLSKVEVDNGARYPLEFGKGGDTGQLSEVDLEDVIIGGSTDDWRNWGGILIEGQNNLNYTMRNLECAGLGTGSYTAQVGNGSCIWADYDYYGGSAAGGNSINIYAGSTSHSPTYGIQCTQCGWLHTGSAGVYSLYGMRFESTSNIAVLANSSAGTEINLYGVQYVNNGVSNSSANYIINDQSSVGAVNSTGSNWVSYMTFNAGNNAPMTFYNDFFNTVGGNTHANVQGYFTPTLAASYNINVLQKNGGQGIFNALTFSSKTAASYSGAGTLVTGSNSFAGKITGVSAMSNQITPGFTCPNAVVCVLQDDTTAGGAMVTSANTTSCTFSATGSDTVEYIASCR